MKVKSHHIFRNLEHFEKGNMEPIVEDMDYILGYVKVIVYSAYVCDTKIAEQLLHMETFVHFKLKHYDMRVGNGLGHVAY